MACNRNDSKIIEDTNSVAIWIDHQTTEELARIVQRGGDATAIVGLLIEAGVITAPAGWVVSIIGIVVSAIGDEINYLDEGCGILFGSDRGQYFWRAQ